MVVKHRSGETQATDAYGSGGHRYDHLSVVIYPQRNKLVEKFRCRSSCAHDCCAEPIPCCLHCSISRPAAARNRMESNGKSPGPSLFMSTFSFHVIPTLHPILPGAKAALGTLARA